MAYSHDFKDTDPGERPFRPRLRKDYRRRIFEKKPKSFAALLDAAYPDAQCTLAHNGPFQLMIATILSAQCTDERVNAITPDLFRRFPDPESFARAEIHEIEDAIRSAGLYRSKAKNIQGACRLLVERHGGQVPRTCRN